MDTWPSPSQGTVDRIHPSVSRNAGGEAGRAWGGRVGITLILFRVRLERCRSPSAKSTFNGNENSLNFATAKFMSSAERSNERGGCDFISWRVMREEGWPESPFYNLSMWDEFRTSNWRSSVISLSFLMATSIFAIRAWNDNYYITFLSIVC